VDKGGITMEYGDFMHPIRGDIVNKCSYCGKKTTVKLKNIDLYSCSSLCLLSLWKKYEENKITEE
jgi:hypothetical protein